MKLQGTSSTTIVSWRVLLSDHTITRPSSRRKSSVEAPTSWWPLSFCPHALSLGSVGRAPFLFSRGTPTSWQGPSGSCRHSIASGASCCTCAHISRVGSPPTWLVPVDDGQTTTRQSAALSIPTAGSVRLPHCRWPEPSKDSAVSKDAVAGGGALGAARPSVSPAATPAIRQSLEGTEGWGPAGGGHRQPLQPWTRHGEQKCGAFGAAGGPTPLTPHSKSGPGPQGLPELNTNTALATNTCNFLCDGLFRS